VGPRSTTRARIHLIAEAGLSTVAGRPWLPDSRSPFLDRLSRFAQPWWALKPRAPRWGTAGAPNGSADRRNPVMLSAREVLPARVWGSSSRSAYSERLGLLMGTGPGACRCSGRSNRRQTLYRHCVSPPETELLTFAPDRTPSSTGGIIRRRSVGWVIIHWFELGTLALLCLNLWFVSSVLNVLRETNRWLAFLTRVRWDEIHGREGPIEGRPSSP